MEISSILLKHGVITETQLEQLGTETENSRPDLTVIKNGWATEAETLRAIGQEMGLKFVDLTTTEVDLSLLKDFPQKLIHRHTLFPLYRKNGSVVIATNDPFSWYPLDEVSAQTGFVIEPVLAERDEIEKQIKAHLGVGSETIEGLLARQEESEEVELLSDLDEDSEITGDAQEASVIRLVNEILLEAIEARASDVHIESQNEGLRIRYRIDGLLHAQPVPVEIHRFHAAIISRLKIMARLNIAEKRLPQDGRIELRVSGREVDVRMSVIPMIHGESIVMRLLDKGNMEFSLLKLGMEPDLYAIYSELIRIPHGIVLVTGPTGSGKTTTLYSSLMEISDEATKIITTEDPVEYQLSGINQIQVHHKIGLSFAASLRSILRHDPDVVLVGEIRDFETAENAIQASLTGHMVFSTLHTNDAPSAYTRLVDMGVEPFLVASTVEAIMAQRLVRRLCPKCTEKYRPKKEDLPKDFPWEKLQEQGGELKRAVGCRNCRELGFAGRQGIFELCITTDQVRELAHKRVSSWEIRQAALAGGMKTLRHDAWRKALAGITTVDEVLRVTKGDHIG